MGKFFRRWPQTCVQIENQEEERRVPKSSTARVKLSENLYDLDGVCLSHHIFPLRQGLCFSCW